MTFMVDFCGVLYPIMCYTDVSNLTVNLRNIGPESECAFISCISQMNSVMSIVHGLSPRGMQLHKQLHYPKNQESI